MENKDIEKLREKMMGEITSLKKDIPSLESASKPIPPDSSLGRLTRMEMIGTKGISESNLRASKTRLARLEQALKKIDDPEFELCRECEEPIPLGRLMLMPEAILCVNCAV